MPNNHHLHTSPRWGQVFPELTPIYLICSQCQPLSYENKTLERNATFWNFQS